MRKRLRHRRAKNEAEIEPTITAGKEDLMEAMTAACALIAFADGSLDITERRRIFTLFRSNPSFRGFSHTDVAIEISRHEAAFEQDPRTARREAFMTIWSLRASANDLRRVLDACQQVLEADGIAHPQEHATLAEIRAVLRSSLVRRART
jgi:tellurite resistance protein TerB